MRRARLTLVEKSELFFEKSSHVCNHYSHEYRYRALRHNWAVTEGCRFPGHHQNAQKSKYRSN